MKPALILIILLSLLTSGYIKSSDKSNVRYNVLFISIDDLRPSIGAYGDSVAITPNIDRLADSGTLFTKAYVQQAVCNPSRASLMTGMYPDQIGVWDLGTHFRDNFPDIITLPEFFLNNGYHTREIGKIFHDPERFKDPQSWSGPSFFHITEDGPGHKYVKPENLNGNGWKKSATEYADVDNNSYIDGKVAEAAIEMLHELKDTNFFLAVGFRRPHLPFSAPEKYWDLYDIDKIPLPENPLSPRGVPEYGLHNWKELRGYTDIPNEGDLSLELTRELRLGYYTSTTYVDALTGLIIDELDKLGLRENTIIILWSDHGFHLGEKNLWVKTTNYELDTRIPLIISVPGQKSTGSRVEAIVESVDIYPTLVDLCGLSVPTSLPGKSLKSFIEDPTLAWDKPAISQFPWPWIPQVMSGRSIPEVMGYSIRTQQFRYIQWNNFKTGEILASELYDHYSDPAEMENLALDENYMGLLIDLSSKLKEAYPSSFIGGYSGF